MTLPYAEIILKKGKEKSIENFHPWIFSGAVAQKPETLKDGDPVHVFSAGKEFLATGIFHYSSIAVRILSFRKELLDENFWIEKIKNALALRQALQLYNNNATNAYRLIHGEGDGISGLIIDVYDKHVVMQAHVQGIFNFRKEIAHALQTTLNPETIYDKSEDTFFTADENRFLSGTYSNCEIKENNLVFYVNWEEGQKTGFFNDQRDNRKLLQNFCKDKSVVNLFAYSGGFSVYALAAGAKKVDSVDSSAKAKQWAENNVALNKLNHHQFYCEDVFQFIKNSDEQYDVWIVDPPAFAKRIDTVKNAMIGYRNLNTAVLRKAKSQSIVFTFSCSQAIDKELFRKLIFQSAKQASRQVKILHQLSQPADHPVSIYHPEGEYLKGLVLYVS